MSISKDIARAKTIAKQIENSSRKLMSLLSKLKAERFEIFGLSASREAEAVRLLRAGLKQKLICYRLNMGMSTLQKIARKNSLLRYKRKPFPRQTETGGLLGYLKEK